MIRPRVAGPSECCRHKTFLLLKLLLALNRPSNNVFFLSIANSPPPIDLADGFEMVDNESGDGVRSLECTCFRMSGSKECRRSRRNVVPKLIIKHAERAGSQEVRLRALPDMKGRN